MNNDRQKIKEHIRRMRSNGVEPNGIAMCYDLWDELGRPKRFAGINCYPDSRICGRFEVR